MDRARLVLKSQAFSLVLIAAILLGSLAGWLLGERAAAVKPLGELFLNALFVTVVPLVFFSISSAVAGMAGAARLLKVLGWMLVVFAATGVVAAVVMLAAVRAFPPAEGAALGGTTTAAARQANVGEQIVGALTAGDFVGLLSRRNMLALIVFAVLVGLATSAAGEKGRPFAALLQSANAVFLKVVSYIMLYAPVGLAAYFAWLVGVFGPQLLGAYLRAMVVYYPVCLGYFFAAFTVYAFLAGGAGGVRAYWSNIPPAALTAAATGSSFATIPASLQAAERIGVPRDIREMVIPIGATIHMDGSVLSAVLKIAFLFGLYRMPLAGAETLASAAGVALLSGAVMSGIPGGVCAGEVLIVTLYGFPPEALPIISMIGTLVDPPATMVNAAGDSAAGMMVARILGGRGWMRRRQA